MTIVYGQVFDPHGRPEGDASVYIVSAPVSMPDIAQLTDGQGRFAMSASVPGTYTLGIRSERWGAVHKTFEVGGVADIKIEVRFPSMEGSDQ